MTQPAPPRLKDHTSAELGRLIAFYRDVIANPRGEVVRGMDVGDSAIFARGELRDLTAELRWREPTTTTACCDGPGRAV